MRINTAPQLQAYQAPQRPASQPETDTSSISDEDVNAIYTDPPGEKHRIAFEATSNVGSAVGGALEIAGKVGQTVELGSLALGLAPGRVASMGSLVGATFDVARGAGITQMSAFNRNLPGAVLGSLQLTQGVASWVATGATLMGAPAIVGQTAAIGAVAAFAGRQVYTQYLKHRAKSAREEQETAPKEEHKEAANPTDLGRQPSVLPRIQEALTLDSQFNELGSGLHVLSAVQIPQSGRPGTDVVPKRGRGLEKTVAFTSSINNTAKKLSNGAAMWNTMQSLWGSTPGLGWGALGVVGGTYTAAQGLSMLRHGAGNLHAKDTVDGVCGILQGAGMIGASMGLGRPAAGLALGATLAKYGIGWYMNRQEAKEGGKADEPSMVSRLLENTQQIWSDASAKQLASVN